MVGSLRPVNHEGRVRAAHTLSNNKKRKQNSVSATLTKKDQRQLPSKKKRQRNQPISFIEGLLQKKKLRPSLTTIEIYCRGTVGDEKRGRGVGDRGDEKEIAAVVDYN